MFKKKVSKIIAISLIMGLVIWERMVAVDYALCKQGQPPRYAVPMKEVCDVSAYKGLGYTIYIGYSSSVGAEGEELTGRFKWG